MVAGVFRGRGFSAPEIGWLMGIRFGLGFFGPVVGQFADKWGAAADYGGAVGLFIFDLLALFTRR